MIIAMRPDATATQVKQVLVLLQRKGARAQVLEGQKRALVEVVETPSLLDSRDFTLLSGVAEVLPLIQPTLLASREVKPEDTVVRVGSVAIGGPNIMLMAGPCAIESRDQLATLAPILKQGGAAVMRGGAFKPRTCPYTFQGLGLQALSMLSSVAREHGMCTISEVMDVSQIEAMMDHVDIFQVGARNMQNTVLLRALGEISRPILLKRSPAASLEELLLSAEYILAGGNHQVMLCERGIRSFDSKGALALDIAAIPRLKQLSHLPVIVDPSHATRLRPFVAPAARAAVAAGADGLLVEVHPHPDTARCDGAQSLAPEEFLELAEQVSAIARLLNRRIESIPSSSA